MIMKSQQGVRMNNEEIKKKADEKPDFEYIIKVDNREVWRGLNVKKKYIVDFT